jgi:hypothetical protein
MIQVLKKGPLSIKAKKADFFLKVRENRLFYDLY